MFSKEKKIFLHRLAKEGIIEDAEIDQFCIHGLDHSECASCHKDSEKVRREPAENPFVHSLYRTP